MRFKFSGVVVFSLCVFLSASATSFAKSKTSDNAYQAVYNAFLSQDYNLTDKMANEYLRRNMNSHREDVLYLQALSLLKLGRSEEARAKFKLLEAAQKSVDDKAAAAVSVGDSHYFENQPMKARDSYKEALDRYPHSAETPYLLSRLLELSAKLYKNEDIAYYKKRLQSEYPASKEAREAARYATPTNAQQNTFFSVQVGSFSQLTNAKALTNKLFAAGYEAYVLEDKERKMYRVRVGHATSEKEAALLEERLKKQGYPTKIYP